MAISEDNRAWLLAETSAQVIGAMADAYANAAELLEKMSQETIPEIPEADKRGVSMGLAVGAAAMRELARLARPATEGETP